MTALALGLTVSDQRGHACSNVGHPQDFMYIRTEGVLLSASKATHPRINVYDIDIYHITRQIHDVSNSVVTHDAQETPCLRLIFT